VSTATTLRLALDQNFPTPLINAVRPYLPATLDVVHLHGIDGSTTSGVVSVP